MEKNKKIYTNKDLIIIIIILSLFVVLLSYVDYFAYYEWLELKKHSIYLQSEVDKFVKINSELEIHNSFMEQILKKSTTLNKETIEEVLKESITKDGKK